MNNDQTEEEFDDDVYLPLNIFFLFNKIQIFSELAKIKEMF